MIKVIALETGYDGQSVREPGAVFEMPDEVFDRRPKLDDDGEPIANRFYEPPSWFEPVDADLKAKVEADRKAIRKQGRTSLRVPAVNPAAQLAASQASEKKP
jgi:hypothetical protein